MLEIQGSMVGNPGGGGGPFVSNAHQAVPEYHWRVWWCLQEADRFSVYVHSPKTGRKLIALACAAYST
jgi:hypothetical protein